ncbi:AMP-dependent synthetase and ligase [Crepidotus variabilis]|uniref:AMP-dependent synthetase and ligase n=1 Tax=Crepidotus variabilis TaxID=179855 RepID=A0A9P6EG51_9AGAR|nr:AMP-dependent synthetase and ligase [Crepidotus variabilis]
MVVLPSGPENAVALLALSTYHTCAPVNASCTPDELKQDALRLNAKAIVTTPDIHLRLRLETFREDLKCQIYHLVPRQSGPAGLFDLKLSGSDAFGTPLQPSLPHTLDDISLILHTSGTSGKKKVVRYSLRTLLVGTWCVVRSWNLSPTDVNLNMMPLFHVGGIVRNLLAPVLSGGSTIVCHGFDPVAFWTLATNLKATWYYAAPTVHHAILLSRPGNLTPKKDMRIRMICNAAGGLLPSLALELQSTFDATVLPSYGMTECMPIATPPLDYALDRPGCSGVPCGPQVSVRNPSNIEQEFSSGKPGAICVRGLPTFDGYETSSDPNVPLNVSVFSNNGWFDSGDLGYLDQDGYLYITGRSKEIINKGGEVVSPFEVEEAVMSVAKDRVHSTLAFSVDHDILQETIGLLVVPASGQPRLGLQQLHDRLKGHLHPSKWPFAIVYIDDLPKNSAGKPLRIGLSSRFGLEKLSDDVPALQRHYEASFSENSADISTPIPCSKVTIDYVLVDQVLRQLAEIRDVGLRSRPDGSLEAYLSSHSGAKPSAVNIINSIVNLIPGYLLPYGIYCMEGPLIRTSTGELDFERMYQASSEKSTALISNEQRVVQNIFAEILNLDPTSLHAASDFFLLGGNSLLLGKLSYHLRKRVGINIAVVDLFADCTVGAIASSLKTKQAPKPVRQDSMRDDDFKIDESQNSSTTAFSLDYDYERDPENLRALIGSRGSTNPLCLIVQLFPYLLFFPLKFALTWTTLLFLLSYLSLLTKGDYWERMAALFTSIVAARLLASTVSPVTAIVFKWIVIGRYRPGKYKLWSTYYLRWWIVNQSLRVAGRGIFSVHPSLTILYYRLLGARIGQGVQLDDDAMLYECDLITLEDGCHIDSTCLRGFRVEQDGYFTLAPTLVGKKAFINASTFISAGAQVPPGAVYGPHASSYDLSSQRMFAAYNRTLLPKPSIWLRIFVAYPLIFVVTFISYIPWMLAILAMISGAHISQEGLNDTEAVIYWFADTDRILFHAVSRVVRASIQPLVQVALGIVIKRVLGLNRETTLMAPSQLVLLRRYISSILLSRNVLRDVFSIIGSHYEGVSMIYRLMGAKIGKRIYWPGSGVYCPEPELLEIGDDVVFGSRSSLITTDRLGSGKIIIENGAMIADRVILLPGTRVRSQAVMGSGALGKRNATYESGSTWLGNEGGEAVCLNPGNSSSAPGDTRTPFGRAFYDRKAEYFVLPYSLVFIISVLVTILSAAYWSFNAVGAARILQHVQIHQGSRKLFSAGWYRYGVLYGLVATCFIITVSAQGIAAMLWVILTKWIIIGRRREGQFNWDKSSYCQRWQLHLTLSRFMYRGYGAGGVLAPLTGTAYMAWFYRAQGAKIGKNCAIWAGGKVGLMTEPDLVELGDDVNLDDCSVVSHLNSRGQFSLNKLKIGHGSAMRSGSRLLSGAAMEDSAMLCEHTLLTSGEIADSGASYIGWPGKKLEDDDSEKDSGKDISSVHLTCPLCRRFPKESTVSSCGHLFCQPCIEKSLSSRKYCPVCSEPATVKQLKRVHLSFVSEEKI